jgi:hypothetical protein
MGHTVQASRQVLVDAIMRVSENYEHQYDGCNAKCRRWRFQNIPEEGRFAVRLHPQPKRPNNYQVDGTAENAKLGIVDRKKKVT